MPFHRVFANLFGQDTEIAEAVFCAVLLTMIVAFVLSWQRRRHDKPPWKKSSMHLVEGLYAVALLGMAIFLINASFSANGKDFPGHDPKPALSVKVTGYQWCWRFHYLGRSVTVNGQCEGGSLPTLVLPAGEPVRLEVTSADVVHAFWVPYWRIKTYAYPGHVNDLDVTMTRDGRWIGRCANICGMYHYEMDFWVKAVPPAQFGTFLHAHGASVAAASGS